MVGLSWAVVDGIYEDAGCLMAMIDRVLVFLVSWFCVADTGTYGAGRRVVGRLGDEQWAAYQTWGSTLGVKAIFILT